MNFLQEYYKNIIFYNFITKFNYQNIFQIPKIIKIDLNIGLLKISSEKKKILYILLFFELITGKKAYITKSKKNKITLQIKKGDIVGGKITLRNKDIYIFLEKLKLFIFPNIQNLKGFLLNSENIINLKIYNLLNFLELKKKFLIFQDLSNLDITIQSNSKTKKEFFFLLKCFNLPIIIKRK